MLMTTTPTIQGHEIETYFGVVSGETIIGANFIKDFTAQIHDFFGGRSSSYEEVLREAKDSAMQEMAERASRMGANAIVGIDLDYETVGAKILSLFHLVKRMTTLAVKFLSYHCL